MTRVAKCTLGPDDNWYRSLTAGLRAKGESCPGIPPAPEPAEKIGGHSCVESGVGEESGFHSTLPLAQSSEKESAEAEVRAEQVIGGSAS